MVPQVTGGVGGWCVTIAPDSGCALRGASSWPILAEGWSDGGPPMRAEGFALTKATVAAVRRGDGGRPIPTYAESALPEHLRAAFVELRGGPPLLCGRGLKKVMCMHLPPGSAQRFTPLTSDGTRMPELRRSLSARVSAGYALSFEVPGREWKNPSTPPPGVCELGVSRLLGLVASAGFVATRVSPHRGLPGRPLVSCASDSYPYQGWPLVASVLLNAADPGSRPPSLPDMRPLAGHSGVYEAEGSDGHMLARRVPGAWLIVARGRDNAQLLRVLRHLDATVRDRG
jgi:hypothetical protein